MTSVAVILLGVAPLVVRRGRYLVAIAGDDRARNGAADGHVAPHEVTAARVYECIDFFHVIALFSHEINGNLHAKWASNST